MLHEYFLFYTFKIQFYLFIIYKLQSEHGRCRIRQYTGYNSSVEETICSLSEQDFAPSTNVLSSLCGALVLAGLQANDSFSCSQLLLGKVALTLLCGPGSQVWSWPLRVPVCLHTERQYKFVLLRKRAAFGNKITFACCWKSFCHKLTILSHNVFISLLLTVKISNRLNQQLQCEYRAKMLHLWHFYLL